MHPNGPVQIFRNAPNTVSYTEPIDIDDLYGWAKGLLSLPQVESKDKGD